MKVSTPLSLASTTALAGGFAALAAVLVAAPVSAADNFSTGQPKVKLVLSGQVNKALLFADDGNTSRKMIVDNPAASTRINFAAEAPVTADFSFGAQHEAEIPTNNASVVTLQGNGDYNQASRSFVARKSEVMATHKRFGKLSLGMGSTATDGVIEADLSNTAVSGNYADSALVGAAILFYNSRTKTTSGSPAVGDVFNTLNGGNEDRVRYDTPTFAGFTGSVAGVSGGASDAALAYSGKIGAFELAATVGYYNSNGISTTVDHRLSGSASVLHSSGLSLTVAGGKQEFKAASRDNGTSLYGKLGYTAKIFGVGPTNFGIDYGVYDDYGQNGDEAKTYSIGAVQQFESIGSQVYILGKVYELDRTATSYDDIKLVMTGIRVAF